MLKIIFNEFSQVNTSSQVQVSEWFYDNLSY